MGHKSLGAGVGVGRGWGRGGEEVGVGRGSGGEGGNHFGRKPVLVQSLPQGEIPK